MKYLVMFLFTITGLMSVSQTIEWAKMGKRITDNNGVYGESITVDTDYNVISAGRYSCASTSTAGGIEFDSEVITGFQTTAFLYHGYIAKYNNTGTIQWVRRIGNSAGNHKIYGVCTDNDNNIYITGYFNQTVRFGCPKTGTCTGGTSLTTAWGNDSFLAKYDENGNFIWVKHITSASSIQGEKIKFSPNSNSVYVNGRFSGVATFGEGAAQVNITGTGSGDDIYIAKYDLNGDLLWVRQGETPQWSYASSLAVDNSDNVYLGGYFREEVTFGSTTLAGVGGSFQINPYVVKYNGSGTVQYARSYTSTTTVDVYALAVDKEMNVYFGGGFSDELTIGSNNLVSDYGNTLAYMAKLNPSGNVLWAKKTGTRPNSDGWSSCDAIAINSNNEIYAFGMYENDCNFDGTTLSDFGTDRYNVWYSNWDTDGNLFCIQRAAGGYSDYANDIDVDDNDFAYISGNTWAPQGNNCNWGGHILEPSRTSTITAKVSMSASIGPITGPTNVCEGLTINYSVTDIPFVTFTWTVPPGSTINSGQGTNEINVTIGSTEGLICVSRPGDCGPACIYINIPEPGGTGTWTWTGDINNNWFNACNWDQYTVPTSTADVLIPSAPTNQPIISGDVGHCKTIEIHSSTDAELTIEVDNGGGLQVHQ